MRVATLNHNLFHTYQELPMKFLNTFHSLNPNLHVDILTKEEVLKLFADDEITMITPTAENIININTALPQKNESPMFPGFQTPFPLTAAHIIRLTDAKVEEVMLALIEQHPYLVRSLEDYLNELCSINHMSSIHVHQIQAIDADDFPLLLPNTLSGGLRFNYIRLDDRESAIKLLNEFSEKREKIKERLTVLDLFSACAIHIRPEGNVDNDFYQLINIGDSKIIIVKDVEPSDEDNDEIIQRIRCDYPSYWPTHQFFMYQPEEDMLTEVDSIGGLIQEIEIAVRAKAEQLPEPPAEITLEDPTPSDEK